MLWKQFSYCLQDESSGLGYSPTTPSESQIFCAVGGGVVVVVVVLVVVVVVVLVVDVDVVVIVHV